MARQKTGPAVARKATAPKKPISKFMQTKKRLEGLEKHNEELKELNKGLMAEVQKNALDDPRKHFENELNRIGSENKLFEELERQKLGIFARTHIEPNVDGPTPPPNPTLLGLVEQHESFNGKMEAVSIHLRMILQRLNGLEWMPSEKDDVNSENVISIYDGYLNNSQRYLDDIQGMVKEIGNAVGGGLTEY